MNDDQMLSDGHAVRYGIKINGILQPGHFDNKVLAETEKQKLPEDQKIVAEIVPLNEHGLEVLLG